VRLSPFLYRGRCAFFLNAGLHFVVHSYGMLVEMDLYATPDPIDGPPTPFENICERLRLYCVIQRKKLVLFINNCDHDEDVFHKSSIISMNSLL
jgi:hypothetical protein